MVSDTLCLFNLLSSLYHPAQLQEVEEEEVLQGSQDCELDGACESSHSEGDKTTTGLLGKLHVVCYPHLPKLRKVMTP